MARVRKAKGSRQWRIERAPLEDPMELVEIGPTSIVWQDEGFDAAEWACPGAIVKITPPPGTPESTVVEIERAMYANGARAVKVMPTVEDVQVVVEGEVFDFSESDDTRSLRQVVMDRVEATTNAHDLPALRELCSAAMDVGEGQP